MRLVLSCEHAGNSVPRGYRHLFTGAEDVLDSHLGYDPGAEELAHQLSREWRAPLFTTSVTRLLVEANRSLHHPKLFSSFSKGLPKPEKQRIIDDHYRPYRDAVEAFIRQQAGRVLHIAVHTFTPVLDGEVRTADVGLLYDPRRKGERSLAADWKEALKEALPDLTIRRNYPYRGRADGFLVALRKKFSQKRYVGIEIEVNQKWWPGPTWARIGEALSRSLPTKIPG